MLVDICIQLTSAHVRGCCLNPQQLRIIGQWQAEEVPLCILYLTSSNDVSAQTGQATLTADWWFSRSGARALHSHTVPHSPIMINGERDLWPMWCRDGRGDAESRRGVKTWWLDALHRPQVHFSYCNMTTPSCLGAEIERQRETEWERSKTEINDEWVYEVMGGCEWEQERVHAFWIWDKRDKERGVRVRQRKEDIEWVGV